VPVRTRKRELEGYSRKKKANKRSIGRRPDKKRQTEKGIAGRGTAIWDSPQLLRSSPQLHLHLAHGAQRKTGMRRQERKSKWRALARISRVKKEGKPPPPNCRVLGKEKGRAQIPCYGVIAVRRPPKKKKKTPMRFRRPMLNFPKVGYQVKTFTQVAISRPSKGEVGGEKKKGRRAASRLVRFLLGGEFPGGP